VYRNARAAAESNRRQHIDAQEPFARQRVNAIVCGLCEQVLGGE
jgi:hypothetical protein